MGQANKFLFGLVWLMSGAIFAADEVDFAKAPKYDDFVISPTGEFLAAIALIENDVGGKRGKDRTELRIINLAKGEIVYQLKFPFNARLNGTKKGDSIAEVRWVKDRRLIVYAGIKWGGREETWRDNDVIAVDVDGDEQLTVFGPNAGRIDLSRGAGGAKTSSAQGEYASMRIIDVLPGNEREILIQKSPWPSTRDDKTEPSLLRLDVYSGKQTTLESVPIEGATLKLDNAGVVRFASKWTNENIYELYYRDNKEQSFRKLFAAGPGEPNWSPIAFLPGDQKVLVSASVESPRRGLFLWDPLTDTREEVFQSSRVDADESLEWSADRKEVIGFRIFDGLPTAHLLPGERPEKTLYRMVVAAFPGKLVRVENYTRDGAKAVVYVTADTDPGSYYLVDSSAKRINKLGDSFPHLNGRKLAKMKPVVIKARDGLELPSYLTLPVGKEAKNLPAVLLVHGGPYGIRDYWGYDAEVQLLAARGYAVLQVNYRGSGGYGGAYQYNAYGKWGTAMQDDLVDATNWLVDQGIADRNRLCISGASYGGYAAVWGITRDPDLYKCAVASVGVYDLNLMHEVGDIQESEFGRTYLERAIGTDEKELRARSPVYHVERIKAGLLLSSGEKDRRVPIDHAERLIEALKKANKPFEYIAFDKEGHGWANEDNRAEYYRKMLVFLDKHIGH